MLTVASGSFRSYYSPSLNYLIKKNNPQTIDYLIDILHNIQSVMYIVK